ncbi:BTAD domain-containing putative transcriptional regulator [Micromonospora sp. NPDC047670]|uniref:AfsR/SARP family transcriptional regulator n=1 Tax=Micromonospora sp. NPDC047670 TaxID=3364252 RepID=UPI00371EB751
MLGPLEIQDGPQLLALGTPRVRTVCAILLVRPGSVVSVEQFVDELWPDRPPADARALVRGYLSRLRQALRRGPSGPAGAGLLVTHKPGYLLRVAEHELDRHRFERLTAAARAARDAGEPRRCVELFREAHQQWRGEPFADVPRTASVAAAANWLTELRLAAAEEQFDTAMDSGDDTAVIRELSELVTAHPLRERLVAQLMVALCRHGRPADALDRYERTRRSLAEVLGADPGPELQQLHRQILNGDPALSGPATARVYTLPVARGPRPRQLPRAVSTFVGRDDELSRLRKLLDEQRAGRGSQVVVIHGAPGVGKSALATHAGNLWLDRFPDGQLYVNLRGASPGVDSLPAVEALGRFLRALGVSAADVPRDVEEAAGLFRTLVADRQMMVLLDNAATAGQIRPLLPAGVGSVVLVTSRANLAALDGTAHLHLAPLSPYESYEMLERLIVDARPGDDRAIRRLAELCGHLPLGLHLAASRLRTRPAWSVEHLVERLADERHRLTELAAGDLAVRSSFSVSYAALRDGGGPGGGATARAFGLLGVLRVAEFDLRLVAALLNTAQAAADLVIERLLEAHLVEETKPGRYQMHDLVQLFARELAAAQFPVEETGAALTRVLGFYLATVQHANRLVYPHRAHYPLPKADGVAAELAGRDDAYRWLEQERPNMVAVIRQALPGAAEHAGLGVALTLALHWFFAHGGYIDDHVDLGEQIVGVTARLGDRRLEAYAHGTFAGALKVLRRIDAAISHTTVELSLCQQFGDRFGEQRALGNLGQLQLLRGDPVKAVGFIERQFEVARDIDAAVGQAFALMSLGQARFRLGHPEEAIGLLERSLAWFDEVGDDLFTYGALGELGQIYLSLGRFQQGVTAFTRGLECARRVDYRLGEAWALARLARAWALSGSGDEARGCVAEAVALNAAFSGTRLGSELVAECAEVLVLAGGSRA